MSDIDDLLNEGEETETTEVEATTETAEATETETEAEKVETEAKAEEAETTAAEESEKEDWTKAAVFDERRKRQEYERKVADLEQQLESLKQGGNKRPDVFEDQDKAFDHVKQEFSHELLNTRLELSQEIMREKHADYDELETEFVEMAKQNPFLIQELNQARFPAKFAYETALKARQANELKDVDKLRAKMEADIRAEIEAKIKQELEQSNSKAAKKQEALSPSLAATRSTGGVDNLTDDSLEAILNL